MAFQPYGAYGKSSVPRPYSGSSGGGYAGPTGYMPYLRLGDQTFGREYRTTRRAPSYEDLIALEPGEAYRWESSSPDPSQPEIDLSALMTAPQNRWAMTQREGPTASDVSVAIPELGGREALTEAEGGIMAATDPSAALSHMFGLSGRVGESMAPYQESIASILEGAKPGDLLAGVDLPDTDLSAVLASDISGLSAASEAEEMMALLGLASKAGKYGGLANVEAQQKTVSRNIAGQRSHAAQQVRGETRSRELEAQEFVSDLQGRASAEAAQIRAGLARTQAEIDAGLATTVGGAEQAGSLASAEVQANMGLGRARSLTDLAGMGLDADMLALSAGEMEERNIGRRTGRFEDRRDARYAADVAPAEAGIRANELALGWTDRKIEAYAMASGLETAVVRSMIESGMLDVNDVDWSQMFQDTYYIGS